VSSPSPERDFARTLLGKAREDLDALGALHERGGIADAILGFHAQQAVEKALTPLLVDQGWELRRTHDIQFLLEQAATVGIELPEPVASASWLTPGQPNCATTSSPTIHSTATTHSLSPPTRSNWHSVASRPEPPPHQGFEPRGARRRCMKCASDEACLRR